MKIIGVCGYAGSGKDTVSDMIAEELAGCIRYSLARPVKAIATYGCAWDGRKDGPGRQLLIDIGTAGRRYNQDVWLNEARDMQKAWSRTYKYMVISDVRFINEADWVSQNGILIRVYREGIELIDHPSERELDDYLTRFIIQNNGTKDDLRQEVRLTLKEALCITL